MKKRSGAVVYSPSDLIRYFASPFASWMDRYHLENPGAITPGEETEDQKLVAQTGDRPGCASRPCQLGADHSWQRLEHDPSPQRSAPAVVRQDLEARRNRAGEVSAGPETRNNRIRLQQLKHRPALQAVAEALGGLLRDPQELFREGSTSVSMVTG